MDSLTLELRKNITNILSEVNEILEEFMPKIGEIGEEDYNSDLDDICCKLLDIRSQLNLL